MKQESKDEDDLVWEIGGVESSKPRTSTTSTVQRIRGRFSFDARLILGAVGALFACLIGYWAVSQWQINSAQEAVRALVRQEDAAAYARDVDGVRASLASDDPAWEDWIVQQVLAGQASPLPDPGLSPQVSVPETTFLSLDLEEAHVQVYRSFKDASGATFRYRFDQRYRQIDGEWMRVPIPADYWGERMSFFGSRLALRFDAADEDLLTKDIGPDVERLLVRFCSGQPCADEALPVRISFVSELAPVGLTDAGLGDGIFLTPHLAGHPIGANAVERFRLQLKVYGFRRIAERTYLTESGAPDAATIERIGVCLGILLGSRDPQACAAIGVR